MTGTSLVILYGILKNRTLVVRVKLDVFQSGISLFIDANIIFWAEFNRFVDLSTNNRSNIRLLNANDAISNTVLLLVEHLLLLVVKLANRFQLLHVMIVK